MNIDCHLEKKGKYLHPPRRCQKFREYQYFHHGPKCFSQIVQKRLSSLLSIYRNTSVRTFLRICNNFILLLKLRSFTYYYEYKNRTLHVRCPQICLECCFQKFWEEFITKKCLNCFMQRTINISLSSTSVATRYAAKFLQRKIIAWMFAVFCNLVFQ